MVIGDYIASLLEMVYPRKCLVCDELIDNESNNNICDKCFPKIVKVEGQLCNKCGKPLDNIREICYDCIRREPFFEQGRALWEYNDEIRESIFRFKYANRKDYGYSFAKEMHDYYVKNIRWEIDIICCVPLHRKRLATRGYNQSHIIAEKLGKELKIKYYENLIHRCKNTIPQKDLSDIERIDNIKNAFSYNTSYKCDNKNILIVDDIYTTGSTINECSKVLLDNNINNVYFLTLAIGRGI